MSIRKVKEAFSEIIPASFHFKPVSLNDIKKEVLNLRLRLTYKYSALHKKSFREVATRNKKTSNYGLETVSKRAQFLWAKLPSEKQK